MYKPADKTQTSFLDSNQLTRLYLNPNPHWVQMADKVPQEVFEAKYVDLFPSGTDNIAKPAYGTRFPDHPEPVPAFGQGTD